MARPIPTGKKKPGLDRVLGRRDLVLLFVVAVANLNLIPAVSASGPISLPAIAAELGLPPRSFQRRLAEERTSFRRLVRDHRRSIAESLIKNHTTTVTSVAHAVGYAETAVLSRAFKSWTGTSPRTYARATRTAR